MSLAVDGERRRGHSNSRPRSRDGRSEADPAREAPAYADIREPSYVYPEDGLGYRYGSSRRRKDTSGSALPYPAEGGGMDVMLPGSQSWHNYDDDPRPTYRTVSPPEEVFSPGSRTNEEQPRLPGAFPGAFPDDDQSKRDSGDERRVRYAEDRGSRFAGRNKPDEEPRIHNAGPPKEKYGRGEVQEDRLKWLPQKYSRRHGEDDDSKRIQRLKKSERDEQDLAYGQFPPPPGMPPRRDAPSAYGSYVSGAQPPVLPQQDSTPSHGSYVPGSQLDTKRPPKYDGNYEDPRRQPTGPTIAEPGPRKSHQDSHRDGHRSSKLKDPNDDTRRLPDPHRDDRGSKTPRRHSHQEDLRDAKPNVTVVDPGGRDRRRDKSPGPSTLGVEPQRRSRSRSRSRDGRGGARDKPPQPPTGRMATLTVDTGRASSLSLAAASGSPLLESYYGTYQDCSPMPSPLLLASHSSGGVSRGTEPLSPLYSDGDDDGGRRLSRRARFHDAEDIASRLARALKGDHAPDIHPLVEILPSLTHEQVMELRAEYKQIVKTGSERKGVNVAKHIRARLKDEEPILMKVCYSVALGKWESEAYWANFWYQGDKTRRELLIESLMGRTNEEIRRIKDSFSDKKYDNSLTKCMKTELKEDKFKKAVLMVLDERRMEEYDYDGRRLPIDYQLVDDDVDALQMAVKSEKGGESLMISIITQRSDSHLRAVLKEYEHHYRANFARVALKKSGNLVGELLAHILNGVINRPVRDALLLNHALTTSRKDSLRRELLISRLVRFHWDSAHMQEVKKAYRERYGQDLQDAVREATSGEWGLFCRELCIARMPNDVRRMERVEIIS